jgi:hypothetical protein
LSAIWNIEGCRIEVTAHREPGRIPEENMELATKDFPEVRP